MIFWDWNGTLLDDARYSMDTMNTVLKNRGLPLLSSLERYRSIFCFPVTDYYHRLGFTDETLEADGTAWMELYIRNERQIPLRDDAFRVLSDLKKAGCGQMLLSASKVDLLEEQTRERGIRELLDGILGLDNIWAAGKISIGKKYMEKSGIDPDGCCMIGDTLHDAEVAQALGCRCVLVSGGHQNESILNRAGVPVRKDLKGAAALALSLIGK